MSTFSFLNRRIHLSWHIAVVSAGIILGSAVAPTITYQVFLGVQWLLIAISLLAISIIKRSTAMLFVALLAGCLLGLFRSSSELIELAVYRQYQGQNIVLEGRVRDDTMRGSSGDQQLRISDITIDEQHTAGQVWVSVYSKSDIKRGDIIKVSGRMAQGFGVFSGAIFRADLIKAERPYPGDFAGRARDWFADKIRKAIPEPGASLGVSYLAGQRRALPETLTEQFRMLGLVHLVVASGFHLAIIIWFTRRLFIKGSKYLAVCASFFVIGWFLLMTGFSTSMTRAALVTALGLIAWYYGRKIHPVVLLSTVAALTLLISPSYIWGDLGWYLSFAAFAGVIILAPLLQRYFWGKNKDPGAFRQILVATIAAQITTFPIIALTFGLYSPLSLIANLLIVPLVPIVMLLTLVAGLAAIIMGNFAVIAGFPAYVILRYMTTVSAWLANTPWSSSELSFSKSYLVMYYAILLGLVAYLMIKTKYNFRDEDII